jgi:hypothetical protein
MKLLPLAFAVAFLPACEGDDPAKPGASAAAPGPVKFTTADAAAAGDYDGTKAVIKKSFGKPEIYVAKNCPQLTCANVKDFDSKFMKATCPKGTVLNLSLEKDLTKGSKQPMASIVVAHGDGSAGGLLLSDAQANEVEVLSSAGDTVVASVNFKGGQTLNGVVGAKVCP